MSNIIQFIQQSGPIGWFIVVVGLMALLVALERIYFLFWYFNINADDFFSRIVTLVSQAKYDQALALCHEFKSKPLARAIRTILERVDQPEQIIFQAQDIALAENMPLFQKRLHYISMAANVSTLLGLLGTIQGLIIAFSAVAQADPTQKQMVLANGISVAMYTTALGLIMAIPLTILFSLLQSRQSHLQATLQEKVFKLVEMLTRLDFVNPEFKSHQNSENLHSA